MVEFDDDELSQAELEMLEKLERAHLVQGGTAPACASDPALSTDDLQLSQGQGGTAPACASDPALSTDDLEMSQELLDEFDKIDAQHQQGSPRRQIDAFVRIVAGILNGPVSDDSDDDSDDGDRQAVSEPTDRKKPTELGDEAEGDACLLARNDEAPKEPQSDASGSIAVLKPRPPRTHSLARSMQF